MTLANLGNGERFATRPLTEGGTPTQDWLDSLAGASELDLGDCDEIVVVAAHPDDETLGFGTSLVTMAERGVRVQVVAASDGGASHRGLGLLERLHLERTRRAEMHKAAAVLGVPPPICLGMPDGELSDHEERLTDLLTEILATRTNRTWIAATWRGDGHPDHEAVGRAAANAAQLCDVTLLEYPIWMWHWATPGDTAVPWHRLRVLPIAPHALDRKTAAVRCYHTQVESDGADAPLLPSFVLRRLLAVREVVF
ncbi:PIG-L deacetylase family protein [Mycobacterium sp. NPDC051804]|uniref:PIG-L deacetylase family protein n=1 Tax=Mycobacterium sp. NPDC051804 TaxID=3364295 RepID=UPI0037A350BC